MVTDTTQLDPVIARAVTEWMQIQMRELKGRGIENDTAWKFLDFIIVLHEQCPDVIARMLQAGAAAYIKDAQ